MVRLRSHEAERILVLGWGNLAMGDDALGVLALRGLEPPGGRFANVRLVEAPQLNIEHVLDMAEGSLVLLVDAAEGIAPPFRFCSIAPTLTAGMATHALQPGELLASYRSALRSEPPPTFLLALAGQSFGLDEPMSGAARFSLAAGIRMLRWLVLHPSLECWQSRADLASPV